MHVLWIYGIGAVLFVIVAAALYARAISSRRKVVCPSCLEAVQMEHDRVRLCPCCGAPLS